MVEQQERFKTWAVCDGCGWECLCLRVGHAQKVTCDCGCGRVMPAKIVKCNYCPTCYEMVIETALKQKQRILQKRQQRREKRESPDEFTVKDFIQEFNELADPCSHEFAEIWINKDRYDEAKKRADPGYDPKVWGEWVPDIIPVPAPKPLEDAIEKAREKPLSNSHLWVLECPDEKCPNHPKVTFAIKKSDFPPHVPCSCCGARLRTR